MQAKENREQEKYTNTYMKYANDLMLFVEDKELLYCKKTYRVPKTFRLSLLQRLNDP